MSLVNDNDYHVENVKNESDISESADDAKKVILDVQENERQRIARDLHDYSLQNLTHLVHKTELCSMYMDKDVVQAKLELAGISKGLRDVIEDIRNIIYNLRPMAFDDLGIENAFDRMLRKLEDETNIKVQLQISNSFCTDNIILLTIYRIVRECAWNAAQHSGGTELFIKVEDHYDTSTRKYYFDLLIQDNGKGFDVQKVKEGSNHYGLSMVRERVLLLSGMIKMDTDRDGTRICIRIPFTENIESGEKE